MASKKRQPELEDFGEPGPLVETTHSGLPVQFGPTLGDGDTGALVEPGPEPPPIEKPEPVATGPRLALVLKTTVDCTVAGKRRTLEAGAEVPRSIAEADLMHLIGHELVEEVEL